MSLVNTVQEIASAFKIPLPKPDSTGEYSFTFDGVLKVRVFSREKGTITLAANVADPLAESKQTEELLQHVLQWNFVRLKDFSETLAWEPDLKQLVLYKNIPENQLRDIPIIKQLEPFLTNLEFWNKALRENSSKVTLPIKR